MIGAIKTATPTFIPSPEPISGLAKMSGMLASAGTRTAKAEKKDDKLPDLLPEAERAIRRQRQQINTGEANLKAYAMNSIKTEYHGDPKKFIAGEQEKYKKDGSGFYGKREDLLILDNKNTRNIAAGKQDYKAWEKSATNLDANQTEGDYYYDANGSRVQRGKTHDNKPVYYKNQEWLDYQSENLGIDEKTGLLNRGNFTSTFKSGALEKEVFDMVKMGAENPDISQAMGGDGNLYTTKTNLGILGDKNRPGLAANIKNGLSRQAKTELRNQFDLLYDNIELTENTPSYTTLRESFNKVSSNLFSY